MSNEDEKNKLETPSSIDLKNQNVSPSPSNEKSPKDKKKSLIKYILYLLIILVTTILVLWFSLYENFDETIELFTQMNWTYFAVFVGMILLYYLVSSIILFAFVKLYYKHYKFHQAVANSMIGNFYNGATPGASGGQVAQIYTFSKQGVSISSAASVMVMSYIVYQICLIIMGIISVCTHIQDVLSIQTIDLTINGVNVPIPIVIFVVFGFLLNLLVIVILFFMSYSTKFHTFICVSLINFLAKIHLCKHPDETREKVRVQVENFRVEFRRLQSNIPFFILVFFLTFLTLIISETYPFLCGLALNGFDKFTSFNDVFNKIVLSIVYTNFHQMITGLIPIPGSSGVSEFVYIRLFSIYYDTPGFSAKGGINAAMLLWRFMSFHIPFLISGIVAGTYKSRGIPRGDRFIESDKKTFYTIQLQTYEERRATSDLAYETHTFERKDLLDKTDKKENSLKNKKDDNDTNIEGKK